MLLYWRRRCCGAILLVFLRGGCGGRGAEIGLVADEHDDNFWFGDLAEVVEPGCGGEKGGAASDVEDEEGTRCAAEVGAGYGFVGLLAGGVPPINSPKSASLLGAIFLVKRHVWGRILLR